MSRNALAFTAVIAALGLNALITTTAEASATYRGLSRGGSGLSAGRLAILSRPLPSSIATRRVSSAGSCPPGQFCRPNPLRPNYPSAKNVPPFNPPPAATIPPRRPAIPPMAKPTIPPGGTLASTSARAHRCQQVCRPIVVGRRCAEARGEYNPQTREGTASHCVRYEPITQTLCQQQCTTGGVYYWR